MNMTCENCCYRWKEPDDSYPCCHWESRAPGDRAPCDEEPYWDEPYGWEE